MVCISIAIGIKFNNLKYIEIGINIHRYNIGVNIKLIIDILIKFFFTFSPHFKQ